LKPFITSLVLCPMLELGLSLAHAQASAKPNDAQIAQIVDVADTIDLARLASVGGGSPAIRVEIFDYGVVSVRLNVAGARCAAGGRRPNGS